MNARHFTITAIALTSTIMFGGHGLHAQDQLPAFAYSSFEGLALDIDGVRLDLPTRESLLAVDPDFRFRMGAWTDSQRQSEREQLGRQGYNMGNIWSVREGVSVQPTPWHAGSLIREVTRSVNIRQDDLKPIIEDFRQAIIDKYGPTTGENTEPVDGRRAVRLIHAVKDGVIADVQCWPSDQLIRLPRMGDSEVVAIYEDMLERIDNGWCDAVLMNYYTADWSFEGRLSNYGAIARDFRLEAESFIADQILQDAMTQQRQDATPAPLPKL